MANEEGKSGSVLIVPFRFKDNEMKQCLINTLNISEKITSGFKFNSVHYSDFLKYHIVQPKGVGYLKTFGIPRDTLSAEYAINAKVEAVSEPIKFNIKEVALVINHPSVKGNLDIDFGYWVVSLEWIESDVNKLLYLLSNTSFFRFHAFGTEGSKRNKDSQKIHSTSNQEGEYLVSLIEKATQSIDPGLTEIINTFSYYQEKFTVLHLLNASTLHLGDIKRETEINIFCYKALRIPPKEWTKSILSMSSTHAKEQINLLTPLPGSRILALDEGAIVLEQFDHFNNIKNKYAPAFLLALNQREVVHFLILRIAEIYTKSYFDDESRLMSFNDLKELLVHTKLFQIFHTISKTSEINQFFQELQIKFMINQGIKDVEESIEEMNQLIHETYRKKQEALAAKEVEAQKVQRKQQEDAQNKLNYLLVAIAVLSIFSAFTDAYELFDMHGKITPHFVWLGYALIIGFGLYMFRNQSLGFKK